jgi:hypothetical protein
MCASMWYVDCCSSSSPPVVDILRVGRRWGRRCRPCPLRRVSMAQRSQGLPHRPATTTRCSTCDVGLRMRLAVREGLPLGGMTRGSRHRRARAARPLPPPRPGAPRTARAGRRPCSPLVLKEAKENDGVNHGVSSMVWGEGGGPGAAPRPLKTDLGVGVVDAQQVIHGIHAHGAGHIHLVHPHKGHLREDNDAGGRQDQR